MVPSAFHWRDPLPLTANGKIDRKALTALAADLDAAEQLLPRAGDAGRSGWRRPGQVLGIPPDQIGRPDFFDRGGTSLSAVQLAIALDRAVSHQDVIEHPVLGDLAGVIDGQSGVSSGITADS